MAIARPLRALGLVAIVAWCFFLYHMFRPSSLSDGASAPPSGKIENMEHDPMMDRKPALPHAISRGSQVPAILTPTPVCSHWRTGGNTTSHVS